MLSVGEVAVVEEPVVSVPVVAPGSWMNEPAPSPEVVVSTVAPFLSQVEEKDTGEEEDSEEGFFFASSAPSVGTNVSFAVHAAESEVARGPEFGSEFSPAYAAREPELVAAAARPQFAEIAEEPSYTLLPRDYSLDFGNGLHGLAEPEEHRPQQATALFPEMDEASQRDLDTPTFMRRLRF
jgi:hypothetical protein